jgi:hypothetical protein
MALSANSVFEVRTAGSDTNGGGFVTGASGTDFSQQNSKNSVGSNISTTDIVAAGTTTLTSATMNGSAAMVGNIIYLQGGTGSLAAGWYQITAFTSNTGGVTTFVVDRTVATGTGITMNIGGALLSPAVAVAIVVNGNIVYCMNVGADGASVFSMTSATANVAGGVISSGVSCFIQGYTSTRSLGNTDARPTFQLNVSTATLWTSASSNFVVQGVIFDGNSQTSAKCFAGGVFVRCMAKNFNAASTAGLFVDCSATNNSANIFAGTAAYGCEAYGNTATPFSINAYSCISTGNTGGTTDGFVIPNGVALLVNCIAVSNGRNGFTGANAPGASLVNCHAESNTGVGFSASAGRALINCSAYGNTGGATTFGSNLSNTGFITVTVGSVFVNAGSNNYLLNNTVNQGALLRAAANPATFPRGLTNNYRDIGAAQHQDSPSTTNIFVIDD